VSIVDGLNPVSDHFGVRTNVCVNLGVEASPAVLFAPARRTNGPACRGYPPGDHGALAENWVAVFFFVVPAVKVLDQQRLALLLCSCTMIVGACARS